ncbi:olfactory receptor 287-like [Rhinophrynus dorsalis]
MTLQNSTVSDFILLGFPMSAKLKKLLFVLTTLSYCIILMANILIITVVRMNPRLHIPMYIFLCNFSIMEISFTTVVIPKMLSGMLAETVTISMQGCLTQFYFIFFTGSVENILLAIMGYDRYLAICNPLHYSSIMTNTVSHSAALGSWLSGCFFPVVPTILISRLNFCSDTYIDHFFCDFGPLVTLSCSDTTLTVNYFFRQAWIVVLSCFIVTVVSYIYIVSTIMKMSSITSRKRAFSTCASHLTVISIFYGTIIFMYVRPVVNTSHMDKIVSLFYSVVTPVLNPIIYSLRNKSIKIGLQSISKWH